MLFKNNLGQQSSPIQTDRSCTWMTRSSFQGSYKYGRRITGISLVESCLHGSHNVNDDLAPLAGSGLYCKIQYIATQKWGWSSASVCQMFVLFLDGGHILHSSTEGPSSSAAGRHVCLEKERALLSEISHPHWRLVFKYSHPYCFVYLFVQWYQKDHAWLLYCRSSQKGHVKGEDRGQQSGRQGPGTRDNHKEKMQH